MSIKLTEEIRTQGGIVRSARTVEEALRLIEEDLAVELRKLPRWTFAPALLVQVQRTGAKNDMQNGAPAQANVEQWLAA